MRLRSDGRPSRRNVEEVGVRSRGGGDQEDVYEEEEQEQEQKQELEREQQQENCQAVALVNEGGSRPTLLVLSFERRK